MFLELQLNHFQLDFRIVAIMVIFSLKYVNIAADSAKKFTKQVDVAGFTVSVGLAEIIGKSATF